jgi:hypothetical protein
VFEQLRGDGALGSRPRCAGFRPSGSTSTKWAFPIRTPISTRPLGALTDLVRAGKNAAKLDAADALGTLADEAGMTLIQMATAFVIRRPAVTSAIIVPRTMEHLDAYLAADGIDLSGGLLDRIDEIVPPESRSTSPTTCGTSARRR